MRTALQKRQRVIVPHPDGLLESGPLRALPMGGTRLEATLEKEGARLRLGIWGGGEVATLSMPQLDAAWRIRPNMLEAGAVRISMGQSGPALAFRNARPRVRPANRPIKGLELGLARPAKQLTADGVEFYELAWGSVALRHDRLGAVVGAGADPAEAIQAARADVERIEAEARQYAHECARLEVDDPLLGSMFAHGLHAAFAAVKQDKDGEFSGLAAGPGYSLPPRTYYRDAYWTLPALWPTQPDVARATIEVLATGVHADGEAPSAVISPLRLAPSVREAIRAHKGAGVSDGEHENNWWRDHFDSPLFFVIMVEEHVRHTGNETLVDGYWQKLLAILERYRGYCASGSMLPLKPYHERDWADNVYRSGLVAYDVGLYHGALRAVRRLAENRDPRLAGKLDATMAGVRAEATERLWVEEKGHFADYISEDVNEDHLAIDTLTTVRFELADERQSAAMLAAIRRQLETRNNQEQPYGDFGVMCCYPPYRKREDLKAKSAFAYRYHNGADWPYWDGAYAGLLLNRGSSDWRYPLLRWWEYSLERGSATPLEYFSPPFAPGAPLQAWSSMPAAAVMLEGFGLEPNVPTQSAPPWGESALRDVRYKGEVGTLTYRNGKMTFRAQVDDVAGGRPD